MSSHFELKLGGAGESSTSVSQSFDGPQLNEDFRKNRVAREALAQIKGVEEVHVVGYDFMEKFYESKLKLLSEAVGLDQEKAKALVWGQSDDLNWSLGRKIGRIFQQRIQELLSQIFWNEDFQSQFPKFGADERLREHFSSIGCGLLETRRDSDIGGVIHTLRTLKNRLAFCDRQALPESRDPWPLWMRCMMEWGDVLGNPAEGREEGVDITEVTQSFRKWKEVGERLEGCREPHRFVMLMNLREQWWKGEEPELPREVLEEALKAKVDAAQDLPIKHREAWMDAQILRNRVAGLIYARSACEREGLIPKVSL